MTAGGAEHEMTPPPSDAPSFRDQFLATLRALRPARMRVNGRERLRAMVGALLGIAFTALLCRLFAVHEGMAAWMVAPIGASAVLVFAVPASPLAQPWPVIGGNTLSMLMGVACAAWIPDPVLAAGVAVGLAIGTMFSLRCLHPPGGAAALLAVLGHTTNPGAALFPMLANTVMLVLAGMVYNSLTGRRYPHTQQLPQVQTGAPSRFKAADFDAALAHYNQVLDISPDDLEALLHEAELAAWRRTLGELRCDEVMSTGMVSARPDTPLGEAWSAMRQRRIKALPVIDEAQHIVGIVTVADFMRHAQPDAAPLGLGRRLRLLLRPGRGRADKPERIEQIMTAEVRTARAEQLVVELVPLFSEGGHHHIPIVDEAQQLAGIITQSDLVRVLYRAAKPE